jgi:hypothetical protein
MSNIEQTWVEYKRNRDDDLYTDNASVVFVPTASGARGYDAVRQFLAKAYDSRVLKISETPIYTTIGVDSIVEEAETTILFVSGDGSWIVPGVDSRHTIDNKVVIPMVTSATFEGDRIASIRVYWDQASVLKQLKLISEKSSWPIVTEKQADSLTNIANAHLNPFGKTVLSAGLPPGNSNEQYPRRNVHTSSRVNQPGGTGGKSSIIFSNEIDDTAASRTRFNSNKNASQFSIGDDDTVSEAGSITGSSRRRGKSQFESGIEFGNDEPEPPTRPYTKPSSRVLKPPGGGGSQITFG